MPFPWAYIDWADPTHSWAPWVEFYYRCRYGEGWWWYYLNWEQNQEFML